MIRLADTTQTGVGAGTGRCLLTAACATVCFICLVLTRSVAIAGLGILAVTRCRAAERTGGFMIFLAEPIFTEIWVRAHRFCLATARRTSGFVGFGLALAGSVTDLGKFTFTRRRSACRINRGEIRCAGSI